MIQHPMKPHEIKAGLQLAEIKQTDIAREVGVCISVVNQVISWRTRSRRVEEAIARALGKNIDDVFMQRHRQGPPAGKTLVTVG